MAPQDALPISVLRVGTGPEVVLVHGGASPVATWRGLERLKQRWTLAFVYRRGFPPSPPPRTGHQDFEVDALDLAGLLSSRPHLVAHSYGGVAAVLAAIQQPDLVRSLTLLEPALFIPRQDAEVARFQRLGDAVLAQGPKTDARSLREFLKAAGAPVTEGEPLPQKVLQAISRAQGSRPPGEAQPDLAVLRAAALPSMVASGGHHPAIERMCDAVAAALGAQRVVFPGEGHFVAAAPGFAERLERFLASATDPNEPPVDY